jgi:ribosomal protein S18 acetylase RimI-like enzyme
MSAGIEKTQDVASATSALQIRLASPDELARVGELTYAAYSHDYDDLPADYAAQLRHPEHLVGEFEVYVAVDAAGEFVGTVAVLRDGFDQEGRIAPGEELYFRLLATAPTARGRGIGAALTTFVIDLARQRGSVRVVMNSGPDMLGAHALYYKLGFSRAGERETTFVSGGRELTLLTFVIDVA